jgi:hypothetical protein
MNKSLEARIAWVLVDLLNDVTEQLWNRYDREFVDFAMEEENKPTRCIKKCSLGVNIN